MVLFALSAGFAHPCRMRTPPSEVVEHTLPHDQQMPEVAAASHASVTACRFSLMCARSVVRSLATVLHVGHVCRHTSASSCADVADEPVGGDGEHGSVPVADAGDVAWDGAPLPLDLDWMACAVSGSRGFVDGGLFRERR